jgi:hypothetical protein
MRKKSDAEKVLVVALEFAQDFSSLLRSNFISRHVIRVQPFAQLSPRHPSLKFER